MIRALRIKNFRGLVDSGWLELRPITVVIGKNSSGKSSFLRLLPLLKQSLAADTKEPILWYGRSVDFGSFNDALSSFSETQEMTFQFRVLMQAESERRGTSFAQGIGDFVYYMDDSSERAFLNDNVEVDVGLTLKKHLSEDGSYVAGLTVACYGDQLSLICDEGGVVSSVKFNGNIFSSLPKVLASQSKNRFFPRLIGIVEEPEKERNFPPRFAVLEDPFLRPLMSTLDRYHHGNASQDRREEVARAVKFGSKETFLPQIIELIPNAKKYVSRRGDVVQNPDIFEEARAATLLRQASNILRLASQELNTFSQNIRYLEPVRARASRFYRFQELSVDEIDPQGENVPMFLHSLSDSDRVDLESWMKDVVGFSVSSHRTGGHTALLVEEKGGQGVLNLTDTGFGYSQVLPLILQLWKSRRDSEKYSRIPRRTRRGASIIAIEQPELHLHPQFQAMLADVFIGATKEAKKNKHSLNLVLETHSEHILNRLGQLVAKKAITSDSISVFLFDRESPNKPTKIVVSGFDENGFLKDPWPHGFFIPQLE